MTTKSKELSILCGVEYSMINGDPFADRLIKDEPS